MEIPLKNKNKEIIAYTIVSKEDYECLSKIKWYKDENYVKSTIKGKSWTIHRYIMIKILGNEITSKQLIDHINGNPLDNKRENLRISTNSENSRNRKKKENTTSKYFGVCLKNDNKWIAQININCKKLQAVYINEIDCAYQYDLWLDEYNLNTETKNNIAKPDGFILWKPKEKKDDLPKGITIVKNKFVVRITTDKKEKYIGAFEKLEDAILARKDAERKREDFKENKLLSTPKIYNDNGNCIFKIKETELIIDEELYYDIIKYKWRIRPDGYFGGYINKKFVKLHRYIMNYSGNNFVDHINNNKLDNRKINLRIVTPYQNSINKSSALNSSSKYIGVSFDKKVNKYQAYIYFNSKKIRLGYFTNEIDSAKARDIGTKKYFGEYGNLNFTEK